MKIQNMFTSIEVLIKESNMSYLEINFIGEDGLVDITEKTDDYCEESSITYEKAIDKIDDYITIMSACREELVDLRSQEIIYEQIKIREEENDRLSTSELGREIHADIEELTTKLTLLLIKWGELEEEKEQITKE